MRAIICICAACLALTAAAKNLLSLDFKALDATGKKAGFQILKADVAEKNGKKVIELDSEKGHFVTVPVKIAAEGTYILSGVCFGDADALYAKITVGGKTVSRSVRQKYMQKKDNEHRAFQLAYAGVPAGSGYLFIAPRGKTGKLAIGGLALIRKENQSEAALREIKFPVPGIIDSDSERIEAAAILDIASGWAKRVPEPRLEILSSKAPGVLEVRFDTSTGELEKSLFPYNFRKGKLTCRLDREICLPPDTWAKYNQLSVLVRPNCPHDRSSLWFDVLGRYKGTGLQTAAPLRGGKWNRIAISWSCLPPEEARKITGISLGFSSFGTPKGEERFTRYEFKDFRLERVVNGTENTWEVSSEKIAVPQTGYGPGENKKALLSGNHPADDFALVSGGKKSIRENLHPSGTRRGISRLRTFQPFTPPGPTGSSRAICARFPSRSVTITSKTRQKRAVSSCPACAWERRRRFIPNTHSWLMTPAVPIRGSRSMSRAAGSTPQISADSTPWRRAASPGPCCGVFTVSTCRNWKAKPSGAGNC